MSETQARPSSVKSKFAGVVRRVLRRLDPATAAYQAQVEHHERALSDITAALQRLQVESPEMQARVGALEEHLPEVLGLWSSASGAQRRVQRQLDEHKNSLERFAETFEDNGRTLDDHARSIQEQWERIEFIRKELMFEMRYSVGAATSQPAGETGGEKPAPAQPVVDKGRVEELTAEHGLKLNLGCGHIPIESYVNVDMRQLPGVDVVAPVHDLPFDDASIDEIFSAHVLEHFAEEQLVRELLPYWFTKLRPGGTFRAVVPDAVSMIAGFGDGSIPFEDLRSVLYGGQEYEGDFHFTMFSPESISALLAGAGFVDIEIEDQARRNDVCLELQVSARRPQ